MLKVKNFDKNFFWTALKVFFPIILAGIIQAAVSFVDNIAVAGSSVHDGQGVGMDKIDLKAVGAGNEIFFLLSAFGMAFTILFGVLFSQFSKNQLNFAETFKLSIWFVSITSIVMALISFFFAEDLIGLFYQFDAGPDKDLVIKHGGNFIKISSLTIVFYNFSLNILNPLTIKGKVKYNLYLSLVSLGLNIILDIAFIYGFKWGAEGSAWATMISFLVQFIISVILLIRNKKWFVGAFNIFSIHKLIFRETRKRFMLFAFFVMMQASFASVSILYSALYGSKYLASMTVGYIIANLLFVNLAATSKGISIFVGPLLGAKQMEKAKEMSKKLFLPNLFIAFIAMATAGIVNTFFPALMLNDSESIKNAQWLITVFIISFPAFMGVTYFSGMFEAGGMQWVPNFWNRGFQLWCVVPVIIILSPIALDSGWKWSIFIMVIIDYLPFAIVYLKYRRFKWLKQIKVD